MSELPNVPRETTERLKIYGALLRKWNKSINLVAPATLDDLEGRHIADSLQLADLAPRDAAWLDLGSGGGLPGLVLAIALDGTPGFHMTLVESDQRKAAFLRTVLRETGVPAKVVPERIESVPPVGADVVTARALAPLDRLLEYFDRHARPGGIGLFPKGERWQSEVDAAQAHWRFHYEALPSKTNPASKILKIGDRARV